MQIRRTKIHWLITFFLVAWSSLSKAQEPYYQKFSFSEGYSFRSVYSIIEDRSGFIWFTGDEGLFRFNGTQFKNFKNAQQTSFSGTYLKEDKYGRIWYQTFDGFYYYFEQNRLKSFHTAGMSLLFPFQISEKYIFILEDKYIGVYDLCSLKLVKKISKKTDLIYTSTLLNGEFYYMYSSCLWKVNSKLQDEKVCSTPIVLSSNPLLCASKKSIYLTQKNSKNNSVFQFRKHELVRICGIEDGAFVQNIQFLKGKLHLTTTDGLRIIEPKKHEQELVYFKNKNFSAVLYDKKDNLWISSPNDGIYLLSNVKLTRENTQGNIPVRLTMVQDELVFTTKNSEINWLNPTNYALSALRKSEINAEGYYLCYNKKDNLLVSGFSDGNTYFDELNCEKSGRHVLKIALKKVIPLDHKYYAVIGTGYAGFFHLPGKAQEFSTFDTYIQSLKKSTIDGLSIYRIEDPVFYQRGKSVIYDESRKTLYFATSNGLFTWKKGVVKEVLIHKSPVVVKSLFSLNGKIIGLLGTKRLLKISDFSGIENEQFEPLFKHSDVSSIRVFKDGFLVQTQHYLRLFRQNKKNQIIECNKLDISNIEVFDYYMHKNRVWISTIEGLLKWDLVQSELNKRIGVFRLNQLLVNDVSTPLRNQVFDYDQNNISIQYSILDFGNKTIERTYFKLNNGNWQKLEPNAQTLNFSSLSPNKYSVQFKGIVFGKPVFFDRLSFTISPPFWSAWWFIAIVVLCFGLLFFAFYNYQINKIVIKNRLINEKIVLESNLNKSMLTALKSQMNPHFFYNVLNSIQGYVLTGEQQKASESIGLISELSRAVLESSRMNEISLHDELELLETYLKLECMRMPKISYDFELAAELRLHDLFLPPMILQPFVENAVKHGLANKTGNGVVKLYFSQDKDELFVTIEDNGIGRVAASQIASMKERKGTSFSTEANKNRIELLNANFTTKITYEIFDLLDQEKNVLGTKVCLRIPQQKDL